MISQFTYFKVMKILVNVPCLRLLGGVANHYLGLRKYWKANIFYNTIGKRSNNKWSGIIWYPFDICKFVYRLLVFRPDVILLNPSLSKRALKRDLIYLRIAKLLGKKVVVFFHGFNLTFAESLDKKSASNQLNKADGIIVLAEEFKRILQQWGVHVPIKLSTTKVDDQLLDGVTFVPRKKVHQILFLARITKEKGIFIALKAFAETKKKHTDLCLSIVGDGPDLEDARLFVKNTGIKDVTFHGRLDGKMLQQAFMKSDLYLFPTSHAEGMPTSVLEAMAFGLPVITRPVGGIKDFFDDGKMGILVNDLNEDDFVQAMLFFLDNPDKVLEASVLNHTYAIDHFLASKVVVDLELKIQSFLH